MPSNGNISYPENNANEPSGFIPRVVSVSVVVSFVVTVGVTAVVGVWVAVVFVVTVGV